METALVVIVILLALLVILFMGIMFILAYKIYLTQKMSISTKTSEQTSYTDEAQAIVDKARMSAKTDGHLGQFCSDHPELPAKGICSLTDQAYCELCLAKENDIRIARKYLSILLDSEWENTFFIPNEKVGADTLNELYRIKHKIWTELEIPLITQQQFKINIENDTVEAFTMVMGRTSDRFEIESKLDFLKG